MIAGSAARKVPVGPRSAPNGQADASAAGPVTTYLMGAFEYWEPECFVMLDSAGLLLSPGAREHLSMVLGDPPSHWQVGVDREKRILDIKPCEASTFGAVKMDETGLVCGPLAKWLKDAGVPGRVDLRWQEQTRSLCGRYRPVTEVLPRQPQAEPVPQVDKEPEPPKEIRVGKNPHKWILFEEKGSDGRTIKRFRCQTCGLITANPYSPMFYKRPCYPRLYEPCYEKRNGRLETKYGAMTRATIDKRLKELKEAAGETDSIPADR